MTLFTAMILLLLAALLVAADYRFSTDNLRAVENSQLRHEAMAAAQKALVERAQLMAGTDAFHQHRTLEVDSNQDGHKDFDVSIAEPACVRAVRLNASALSSVSLDGLYASSLWHTVWKVEATATAHSGGALVRVVQALRYPMSDADKQKFCT